MNTTRSASPAMIPIIIAKVLPRSSPELSVIKRKWKCSSTSYQKTHASMSFQRCFYLPIFWLKKFISLWDHIWSEIISYSRVAYFRLFAVRPALSSLMMISTNLSLDHNLAYYYHAVITSIWIIALRTMEGKHIWRTRKRPVSWLS
jgi:hypothetical protein